MPSFPATEYVNSAVIYSTAALLLLPSVVSGQGQFGCESGLRYYRYYASTRLSWTDAVTACEANARWGLETGMLASIRTLQDRAEVVAIGLAPTPQHFLPTLDDIWIGATRREGGGVGDWRWISTNEVFFSNNVVVAPQTLDGFGPTLNPAPGEDYAALEPTDHALPWVPRDGTALNPYLCEMCQLSNAAPPRRCSNATLKTYRVVRDPQLRLGWADAQLACRRAAGAGEMGNLATVRTDAEKSQLVQGFGGSIDENVWIGATDSTEEGNWRWLDNNELFYTGTNGVISGVYQAGQEYQGWGDGPSGGLYTEPNDITGSWTDNADYASFMVNRGWADCWAQTQQRDYVCDTCTCTTIDNILAYARDCTVESCQPGFAPNTKRDNCEVSTPMPTTPMPTTPMPTTPMPTTPMPTTPMPTTPMPTTPAPITPVPITPVPITPVLSTPVPTTPTSARGSEPTPEPTEKILAADDGFNYLWLLLLLIPCCLLLAALALVRRRNQKSKARSKHTHFDATSRAAGRNNRLDDLIRLDSRGPGPLELEEEDAPVQESHNIGHSENRIDDL